MKRLIFGVGRFVGRGLKTVVATALAICIIAETLSFADYFATVPGSGATFASVVISAKHYVAFLICDATVGESQCAAVDSSGNQAVKDAAVLAAIQAAVPAGSNTIGNVNITSQYPVGATAITASATGTTAATTATLAGTSGKTTYICSRSVRANATAATTVTDTLTGVITGTISSILWVAPAASGLGVDEEVYSPCVPASAQNTGISVVSGAPGTGGNVSVHATGYQL